MSYFMDSSSEESCCEEAVSGSTLTKVVEEKAKRKTKVPLKLKDYVQEKESLQKRKLFDIFTVFSIKPQFEFRIFSKLQPLGFFWSDVH